MSIGPNWLTYCKKEQHANSRFEISISRHISTVLNAYTTSPHQWHGQWNDTRLNNTRCINHYHQTLLNGSWNGYSRAIISAHVTIVSRVMTFACWRCSAMVTGFSSVRITRVFYESKVLGILAANEIRETPVAPSSHIKLLLLLSSL